MYVNKKVIDCGINWEIYKLLNDIEVKKGDLGNPKNVATPKYDVEDPMFRTLIETIAFSTTSFFSYTPTEDQIRIKVAKMLGKSVKDIPKNLNVEDPLYKDL